MIDIIINTVIMIRIRGGKKRRKKAGEGKKEKEQQNPVGRAGTNAPVGDLRLFLVSLFGGTTAPTVHFAVHCRAAR